MKIANYFKNFFTYKPNHAIRNEILRKHKVEEFKWYHNGPWWDHPLWGDTWKGKNR